MSHLFHSRPVIIAQLGARDHYSFVRALHQKACCEALITDFWWDSPVVFPGDTGRRISGRFHADLDSVEVMHSNLATVAFELQHRMMGVDRRQTILERNRFFQKRALASLQAISNPSVERCLFAYSYAARDIFRWAKSQGWKTVLGQIDPGPEEGRMTEQLRQSRPEFKESMGVASEEYYSGWSEELELADFIVVNSEWSAKALRKEGVQEDRLRVIPIPYEARGGAVPHNAPAVFSVERPLRVLFLGQVNLRKGIVELLEAMELLEHDPVELDVVGPVQVHIPERFRGLSSVRFHGSVPRSMIGSYFGQADLFVFPTHSDGFGLTQLEAMAAGLPVLSSRNCAAVVKDGLNGMLLDKVSGVSIAKSIHEVLQSPSLLTQWSRGCGVPTFCRMDNVAGELTRHIDAL
ncbi:MAG: glycosyltransferase family 4 protein [Verrucomicrobiales bacterium]|nr:glycosyltransferase family 4 protein [Verrucomicrobiales bacterium]